MISLSSEPIVEMMLLRYLKLSPISSSVHLVLIYRKSASDMGNGWYITSVLSSSDSEPKRCKASAKL